MPSWLGGTLVKWILDWLWGKVSAAIGAYKKDKADHESAVNQAAQDNEKASHINEKSSSDEIDEAIDESLKHL